MPWSNTWWPPDAGPRPVDVDAATAGRVSDRAWDIESSGNHFQAGGGESWRVRSGAIAVPTLVLPGDRDALHRGPR